jgi:hypothetical protein
MKMTETTDIQRHGAGTIARQEFSGQELVTTGETVATVLAARAKAEVEARFIMAMQRPRNLLDVRKKLLDACERPGFAGNATEKGIAWYRKPIGQGVEGFTIRFAEEALRAMGNMDPVAEVIWEDDRKRIIAIKVTDLENNISTSVTTVIEKTIERKKLKRGEVAISERINSYGEVVYLRQATEDEILQKQNSAISKAMRNGILRLVPGDIQAECRDRIFQIRAGDIAKDPGGWVKKIADGFAKHGVKPSALKKLLGHDLEESTQAELADLRSIWDDMRQGRTTWGEIMALRFDEPEDGEPVKNLNDLTARLKAEKEEKEPENPDAEPAE